MQTVTCTLGWWRGLSKWCSCGSLSKMPDSGHPSLWWSHTEDRGVGCFRDVLFRFFSPLPRIQAVKAIHQINQKKKKKKAKSIFFLACLRFVYSAIFSFALSFLAVEPGYYEDGSFGIRIENVVLVVPAKPKVGSQTSPSSGSSRYFGCTLLMF